MRTLYESILDPGFARRDNAIDVAAKAGKAWANTVLKSSSRVSRSATGITYYFDSPNDKKHPERARNKILAAVNKMVNKVNSSGISQNQQSNARWTYENGYFVACAEQENGQYLMIIAKNDDQPGTLRPYTTFHVEVCVTNNGSDPWVVNLMRSRWGEPTSAEIIFSIANYLGFEV